MTLDPLVSNSKSYQPLTRMNAIKNFKDNTTTKKQVSSVFLAPLICAPIPKLKYRKTTVFNILQQILLRQLLKPNPKMLKMLQIAMAENPIALLQS